LLRLAAAAAARLPFRLKAEVKMMLSPKKYPEKRT
jgi:hypothetical protein